MNRNLHLLSPLLIAVIIRSLYFKDESSISNSCCISCCRYRWYYHCSFLPLTLPASFCSYPALLCCLVAVPIPYKNCGKGDDKFKITKAEASIWPPQVGKPITFSVNGTLSQDVSGGKYEMKVKILGIQIMDEKGTSYITPLISYHITPLHGMMHTILSLAYIDLMGYDWFCIRQD
jgi:hypothetical protein